MGLDRFYDNIQNDRVFIDNNEEIRTAENAWVLIINSAMEYGYYFTEHILFYTYEGYTLNNEIRLRDENQESVYVINNRNTFF